MAGTPANALNVNAIGMLYLGSFNNQVVSIAPGLANTVLASSGIGSVPGFSNLGALGGVTSIITNSGTATPASGVINLSGTNSGNSLTFSGASNNIQLNIQDSGGNIFLGILSGNTSHDGSAEFNVGIGGNTLEDINNSAIGNVAISSQSLQSLTSGNGNIAISDQSLINLLTGSNNIALGSATGTNYSSSEYSNILIGGGITGTESEHNVLRIGNGTGTSAGQLNNAFVSGINGNTSASPAIVTTDTTTDQLGTMPYVKNATFTPTLNGATFGTTVYNIQNGYYTRIGNMVFVQGFVDIASATGTGNLVLGGLPLTINAQTQGQPIGSVDWAPSSDWPWPAGCTSLDLFGLPGTTTALIGVSGTGEVGGLMQMFNGALAVSFSLTYTV